MKRSRARSAALGLVTLAALGAVCIPAQVFGDVSCVGAASADDPGMIAAAIFGEPRDPCVMLDSNLDTALTIADIVPVLGGGPLITFFGLIQADDTLIVPGTVTADGIPQYIRANGIGFGIVVEGMPGSSGAPVGTTAYEGAACSSTGLGIQAAMPRTALVSAFASFPDLQVEASNLLGNGSTAVCDNSGTMPGGVPAIDPPNFDATPGNIDTLNDLGCRFQDGSGAPCGRSRDEGCVQIPPSDDDGFQGANSTIQFCAQVDRFIAFAPGDTLVSARLRDQAGATGPAAQILVHIGP